MFFASPSRYFIVIALGVTALLQGCVATQPVADGGLLQRMDLMMRQARPSQPPMMVTVTPNPVVSGQSLSVEIGSPMAGHLYVYQIGTNGHSLNLVFPNAIDGQNFVSGGRTSLPRPGWRLNTKGPDGVGYLIAVLANQPQDLTRLTTQAALGEFAIEGAYLASSTSLREVTHDTGSR